MPSSPPPTAPGRTDDPELLLPAATAMDAVVLHVADLARTSAYYCQALGLEELPDDLARPRGGDGGAARPGGAATAVLGRGAHPLVVLVHTPDLPPARPGQAGLFHTALLFADRSDLAAAVVSAARHPLSHYVGSADHLVSQAFYFTDPEGNGLELYWDRPRETWGWEGGRVQMASLPLDPEAFVREHLGVVAAGGAPAAPGGAAVGHVHLKVGDIAAARRFYVDVLGFEVTADLGSALFVAAGGYHHHLGMNTWQSAGAGPRAATIGLGAVSVVLPGRAAVDALAQRLAGAGVPTRDDGRTLRFEDPWRSLLEVSAG